MNQISISLLKLDYAENLISNLINNIYRRLKENFDNCSVEHHEIPFSPKKCDSLAAAVEMNDLCQLFKSFALLIKITVNEMI